MPDVSPQILECTLRDGSYALDFQFTESDTARIARRLDELGFPYIEVGHGIGLGASRKGKGTAAATDEEYMRAAAQAVVQGKWGMFCIPGIADLDDIVIASDHGMDFVRVGCEITDVENTRTFIESSRERGIYVFSNLMKSYASPVTYFVEQVEKCLSYGSQCIYIVDSAGGMLPDEIGAFVDGVRDKWPDVKLGFHGHNNLGMGVGNALLCAQKGVDIIDTSLQGYGRSSGNVPTEQLIAVLKRAGYDLPYELVDVMQAGEELVRPLMREVGHSSLDIAAGYALFHSSYMRRLLDVAQSRRVDPRRLIIELCQHDLVNAPIELIESCAETLTNVRPPETSIVLKQYFGEEQL